jgi:hypothetical protein
MYGQNRLVALYCVSLREASCVHRRGVAVMFLRDRKQFSTHQATSFQDFGARKTLVQEQTRLTVPYAWASFGVVKGPARPGPPATSSPARTHPTRTTSATTTVLTLHLHIYPRFLLLPTARLLSTTSAPPNPRTAIHSTRQIRIPIEKGPRPPLKRPTRAFHTDASDHRSHSRPPAASRPSITRRTWLSLRRVLLADRLL